MERKGEEIYQNGTLIPLSFFYIKLIKGLPMIRYPSRSMLHRSTDISLKIERMLYNNCNIDHTKVEPMVYHTLWLSRIK